LKRGRPTKQEMPPKLSAGRPPQHIWHVVAHSWDGFMSLHIGSKHILRFALGVHDWSRHCSLCALWDNTECQTTRSVLYFRLQP
jgi:hypothetical protein